MFSISVAFGMIRANLTLAASEAEQIVLIAESRSRRARFEPHMFVFYMATKLQLCYEERFGSGLVCNHRRVK